MKVWRLMVFRVPGNQSALLSRLRFRPTKANPANWWRTFDPRAGDQARAEARFALGHLKQAGLGYRWDEVEHEQGVRHSRRIPADLSIPNVSHGAWRRKQRRR